MVSKKAQFGIPETNREETAEDIACAISVFFRYLISSEDADESVGKLLEKMRVHQEKEKI